MEKKIVEKNKWLIEVSFLRPLAIVLVVLSHSFAVFGGAWNFPGQNQDKLKIGFYEVLPNFLVAFRMPIIVFVAGYVFMRQMKARRYSSFKVLLLEKQERLLIPCLFFSFFYVLFFEKCQEVIVFLWEVLQGAGHLWYLFMLIWVFFVGYIIYSIKYKVSVFILLIIFHFISSYFSFLPFQFDKALYYIVFFYLGMIIYNYRSLLLSSIKIKHCFYLLMLFLVCFVCTYLLRKVYLPDGIIVKLVLKSVELLQYLTSCLFLYFVSLYLFVIKENRLPEFFLVFGKLSYGVYVFHQFILMYLVYSFRLDLYCNVYFYPWILFIVTFLCSVLLTKIVLQTKLGKYLIG
ncbi:acyltransferase family protein [Myroides marinus]|uniref:acyltransferase family protein n=1 Tax=Myroides marinus TaxID=703342 RepID=UPI002577C51C|nr:acyltransferase family protein [Myroides marinus]MDM1380714.1 acyltransferase family protein [Myroides marinus]MDM1387972.1 acyltransferase family protein [Myroides marinus]MDM1395198.1 acyltransferase family protein [Myroides marinus]